jgi:HNH endonuclease
VAFLFSRSTLSKEEIIAAIKACAQKLGRAPHYHQLRRTAKISERAIRKFFGTYTSAVRASGMELEGAGRRVPMQFLFLDWAALVRRLGKLPTTAEYETHSKYTEKPLTTRFGNWQQTPLGLLLYAEKYGLAEEWKDVLDLVRTREKTMPSRRGGTQSLMKSLKVATEMDMGAAGPPAEKPRLLRGRPVYGPSLNPMPLAHGPTNEDGVLFLFGVLAERLGFVVLRIQKGFPDCEAMRRIDEKAWQFVRIEFEFESRNFLKHLHDPAGCDLIVCWEHNWPACPLEVVELKKALAYRS